MFLSESRLIVGTRSECAATPLGTTEKLFVDKEIPSKVAVLQIPALASVFGAYFSQRGSEYASKWSGPWRGRLSAFHFGPKFDFLFPHRQVGASWRRLGCVHRLPDVVPRCRSATDLQVPGPRRINPGVDMGQHPL